MERQNPIKLGYHGSEFLEVGDRVLYKIGYDNNYVHATVSRVVEKGCTGVYVKLVKNYVGQRANFSKNKEILAGSAELYWDRKILFPTNKLERILELLNQA